MLLGGRISPRTGKICDKADRDEGELEGGGGRGGTTEEEGFDEEIADMVGLTGVEFAAKSPTEVVVAETLFGLAPDAGLGAKGGMEWRWLGERFKVVLDIIPRKFGGG